MGEVTRILDRIDRGDAGAASQLLPLVYDELRKLAAARMATERPGHTLDATALVHEAYLRLVASGGDHAPGGFANRSHFFAAEGTSGLTIWDVPSGASVCGCGRTRSWKRSTTRSTLPSAPTGDASPRRRRAGRRAAPSTACNGGSTSRRQGTINVWDAATGRLVYTLGAYAGMVNDVAFSPAGRRLATASADQTVKVWDVAADREMLTLCGHDERVVCVAFSPDGRYLASASATFGKPGQVKLWDAGPPSP